MCSVGEEFRRTSPASSLKVRVLNYSRACVPPGGKGDVALRGSGRGGPRLPAAPRYLLLRAASELRNFLWPIRRPDLVSWEPARQIEYITAPLSLVNYRADSERVGVG